MTSGRVSLRFHLFGLLFLAAWMESRTPRGASGLCFQLKPFYFSPNSVPSVKWDPMARRKPLEIIAERSRREFVAPLLERGIHRSVMLFSPSHHGGIQTSAQICNQRRGSHQGRVTKSHKKDKKSNTQNHTFLCFFFPYIGHQNLNAFRWTKATPNSAEAAVRFDASQRIEAGGLLLILC